MSDLTHLGKGIKFPFRFYERTGGTQESEGLDRIRESIIQILEIRLGERLKRPDFGSKVKDLVFEQNDAVLKGLLRYHVVDAIKRWEKRIVVTDVSFDDSANAVDANSLLLCIKYRVVDSQVEGNLIWSLRAELS